MNYAGFWIRFVAIFIDGIILGIITSIIQFLLLGFGTIHTSAFVGLVLLTTLLQIGVSIFYLSWFLVTYGQTPGKMIVKIKVVQADGLPNSWGTILLRESIGRIISSAIIDIGYIWAAFDNKKQGWHDKIAGTYVVKLED